MHAATLENYAQTFNPFIKQFPTLPLEPKLIEDYLGGHYADMNSRWHHWTGLKAFYHFYCKAHHIYNPMIDVPHLKMERHVRQTLTLEQLTQLLELDLSPRDRAIIMLLIDCGPRSGEIVSLTRERVLEGAIIIKGKTGEHEVPITKETHDLLVQLAASGPLFRTEKGPLTRQALYHIISRHLQKIGWTGGKRGAHMLRHTLGRRYVEEGGDISSLKGILGHDKIETTQIYSEMSQQAVKREHEHHNILKLVLPQDHDKLVQVIRAADPNLAKAIDSANQWLCRCRQCAHDTIIAEGAMERTRCPQCGAVGCWFVMNHINAGEGSGPHREPEERASVPVKSAPPEQASLFSIRPEPVAERLPSSPPGKQPSGRKGAP